MEMNTAKILFMHDLDSSRESSQFKVINSFNKVCINVDYRNLNFGTVERFYSEIIEKIQPNILVGHSLGGYWALKMSNKFNIPTVIVNPYLSPDFDREYPEITEFELMINASSKIAYIELGDEIIDMHSTSDLLELFMPVESIIGGHHQIENPERINQLIQSLMHSTLSISQ